MKKQFLRVKQIADQTFLRAEKTEVLTENLVNAEKRVEAIRISCQAVQKKITSCLIDFGSEPLIEKRLKKIPHIALATSMLENSNTFVKASVLGDTLRECALVQNKLGNELLEYYNEVEKSVLKPISSVLENEVHNISKLRKQLGKLVLDMDSARTRFHTAERHSLQTSNTGINTMGKVDTLKDELEEASQKVDQCRDALAAEMFTLISKEPQLAKILVHFHQLQANYHRNVLAALEESVPFFQNQIADFPQKPVYGCNLDEHLRVTDRQIALVIETCILFLQEFGIVEEGLLRIAGSASKLKKLKSAFDAGIEIDITEFERDPHAVSGALKSYLRELPEPLMTFILYDEWMNAAKIPDFDSKLQALWQVLHKLPEANFVNLQYVIKFLAKLYENVEINKMSSQNIAIVMAPNLLWSPMEDASATFGMNMTTASFHTAIVDLLISYADWFFPDSENFYDSKMKSSNSAPNLNASNLPQGNNDCIEEDLEINGNNLQVISSSEAVPPSCSPRTYHRLTKKPAAPPPPAQKLTSCDKKSIDATVIPTEELIDFSGEKDDAFEDPDICPKISKTQMSLSNEKTETNSTISVIRRKSNENISIGETPVFSKTEKPVVPDKPSAYSTYSLDRRSQRPASVRYSGADGVMVSMSRSQIERPSVPPPERPAKPSRFSSSENLSGAEQTSKGAEDTSSTLLQSQPKSAQSTSEPLNVAGQGQDDSHPVSTATPVRPEPTTATIQHSKSTAKVNRFDFLVNQNSDKPPERPPRSTYPLPPEPCERTSLVHEVAQEVVHQISPPCVAAKPSLSDSSDTSVASVSMSPPPACRSVEGERVKPPRPQPPVPAKPKLNSCSENTSL